MAMTTARATLDDPATPTSTCGDPSGSCPGAQPVREPNAGPAERCRAGIIEQLQARNEHALIRTLASAADDLSSAERPMACWIPCLLGLDDARRRGRPFSCASMVAHFIAVSARVALTPFPVRPHAPWLVGMTVIDQSAAHLIALLLAERGVSARPWWAPDMPRRGTYLMVSTVADDGLPCDDERCLGALTLEHEATIAGSSLGGDAVLGSHRQTA
jgi:hypothetical protein